ncbi:Innexin [Fasciola gigantica]|uniref:Innexin n=1 Tax=Fasciola gigantica TaxID=46835 RepID=A0A504YZ35_FASGI|nr:Innexin [Fasciola gigantica]
MASNLANLGIRVLPEGHTSTLVSDPMCHMDIANPCACLDPCLSVPSIEGDRPGPQISDHSSSDCQWSTEEHILKRLYEAEGAKLDAAFFYSGMHDAPVLHSPYLYESYEYGFPHSSLAHSPNAERTFSRHHAKLSSDPTILLTLVRWARIGSSKLAGDDDHVDRLNYQFTTLIILVLITLTGLRQYISHLPLQCWIPQEFSRSWEEYAEHYCWVTNTYFSNIEARLPPPEGKKNVVRYYQWATFVLGLQAAGFILPCLIWRLLQNYSGFQVKRIMNGVMRINFAPNSTVTRSVRGIAHYMDAIIYYRKYKFWRNLHVEFKQENVKTHSCGKESVELLSKPVHQAGEPVKSVQFRTPSSGSAEDYGSTTGAVSTLLESSSNTRKKGPAPSPPIKSLRGKVTTFDTRLRSTVPSSGHRVTSLKCCSPKWGNLCRLCISSSKKRHGADDLQLRNAELRKKRTKSSESDPDFGERVSSETVQPLIVGDSDSSQDPSSVTQSGCACCQPEGRESSNTKIFVPLTRPGDKTGHVQMGSESSRWKHFSRVIGNAVWFSVRLLLTLIFLIPGCLCHCLRGTQKTKCVQRSNSFLFYLYVTMKLLYLLNLIGQMYFMKFFLDTESHFFGFYVLRDLIQGRMWTQTGNFPRVTYCDFEAKKPGKNYRYTLQCVLPLNLFLEKIYIFLWFWMIFVAILTAYSLLKWLSRLSIPQSRRHFVRKFLIPWKLPHGCDEPDRRAMDMFIDQYLDLNGVFILWLIATNAGELISGELIAALWELFQTRLTSTQSAKLCLLDLSDSVLDCSNGVCERSAHNNYGTLNISASTGQTHCSLLLDNKQWEPRHLHMGNPMPSYCAMPKRRVHNKARAPDIPYSRFTSRKSLCPSSSTLLFPPIDVNEYNQMDRCVIDSSLDSIV